MDEDVKSRFEDYETAIPPSNLSVSEIPGKFSTQWFHRISIENGAIPPPGSYPAMIKVFYGKGKVAQAPVLISVRPPSSQ